MSRKKIFSAVLAIGLIITFISNIGLLGPAVVQAQFSPLTTPEIQGKVIILADEDLLSSNQQLDGLNGDYSGLSRTTAERRILRYADDIRSNLPNTKVVVVGINSNETPQQVASTLRNEYFNQNLEGVIIVGDVPLPVVNKNGNRFISLYPYTDFEDVIYNFNPETTYFEPNSGFADFEPEIWHGVIQFTEPEAYASFFDKNHLFYEGREGFDEFDEKIFYADPIAESKSLNNSLLTSYQNYIKYAGEIAYNRYSKKLLQAVSGSISADISSSSIGDIPLPTNFDEQGRVTSTDSLSGILEQAAASASLIPDLQTKPMIENYFGRVTDLFSNALGEQRIGLLGTGRYSEDDYYTGLSYIAQKDDYMLQYLLQVNNLLEQEIDEIVDEVQSDIAIPNGATLVATLEFDDDTTAILDELVFVNNSPNKNFRDRIIESLDAGISFGSIVSSLGGIEGVISSLNTLVNGQANITSAAECPLYAGGGINSELSKSVEMWRRDMQLYTEEGAPFIAECANEWQGADRPSSWRDDDANACNLFYGSKIKDDRFKPATLAYPSLVTHEACFNMRPANLFLNLINGEPNDDKREIGNQPVDSRTIALEGSDYSFTLADILEDLEGYNADPEDWNAWSSYLLGNPQKSSFDVPNPLGEGNRLQNIKIEVTKINAGDPISSVVHHKEPTLDTIQKATEAMVTKDLPMDQIRYVTFVDQNGLKQQIIYPDLFSIESLQVLNETLSELETLFTDIGDDDYTGQLQRLVRGETDNFNDDLTELSQASSSAVADFIDWKNLNLNQKYTKILTSVLDQNTSSNLVTAPESFEIAVITSDADNDSLNYSLLEEESFKLDPSFRSADDRAFAEVYEEQEDERESNSRRDASRSIDSEPLIRWLTYYIPEVWIPEVTNLSTGSAGPGESGVRSYEQVINSGDVQPAEIEIITSSDNISLLSSAQREVTFRVLDSEGNQIIGQPVFINYQITGPARHNEIDENEDQRGDQLFVPRGEATIKYTPTDSGDIIFKASTTGVSEVTKQVTVHEELKTQITLSTNSIQVADAEGIIVTVSQMNEDNQVIPSSELPTVKIDNTSLGTFSPLTEIPSSNEYRYEFLPEYKSGTINLSAKFKDSIPSTLPISITPASPSRLFFPVNKTVLNSTSPTPTAVQVQMLDEYGNKITNANNSLNLTLSNTEKAEILTEEVSLSEGEAEISVQAKEGSFGNIFLRVAAAGFEPSYHKLELGSTLTNADFRRYNSQNLYLELRTGYSPLNTIAPQILSQGKTQTISTLTADLNGNSPLFYMHRTGGIELIQANALKSTVSIGADKIDTKVYDNSDSLIATTFITPGSLDFKPESENYNSPGIYLESYNDNLTTQGNTVSLGDQEIFAITDQGIPVLTNDQFSFRLKSNNQFYTLALFQGNNLIADLIYNFDSPGAVTVQIANHAEIEHASVHTLPSSTSPKGEVFYSPNSSLSSDQLPSSSTLRMEDSLETAQVGLAEGHKSILLFSSGHTAGEANQPYLSEAGIVLGDPVIKLPDTENYSSINEVGYDIGKYLGRTKSTITDLLEKDDYVLIADEEGGIYRLDKGTLRLTKNLVKIPNGIKQLEDFGDQVLILSQISCVAEDSCVYSLSDEGDITPINLESESKISQIFTADFTGDGDIDIATVTDHQNLRLYLNQNDQIDEVGTVIGSTSTGLDTTQNLIGGVWISNPNGEFQFLVPGTGNHEGGFSAEQGWSAVDLSGDPDYVEFLRNRVPTNDVIEFSPVNTLESLSSSTLRMQDINGGSLRNNDRVRFTLTLNSEGYAVSNGAVSIPLSENFEFIPTSVQGGLVTFATGDPARPFILSGLNISNGQTVQVRFEATYKLTGNEAKPIVQIVTDDSGYEADGLPDFKVSLPGTQVTTYYYSTTNPETGNLTYAQTQQDLGSADLPDLEDQVPDLESMTPAEQRAYSEDLNDTVLGGDSDGDGILDSYDSAVAGLNNVAEGIEGALENFACASGGCLALPINHAFLVPGSIITSPVIGFACPSPIGILSGPPAVACGAARVYISPTLTGVFMGSLCTGSFASGPNCFTFRITDLGSLCDAINEGIQDLINAAAGFVESAAGSLLNVGPGDGSTGSNIQLPGFPAVFTNWVSAQIDEIVTNLFDLPNITVIYPDIVSLIGTTEQEANVDYMFLEDLLAEINSMPLFDITTETHYIKYPIVTPDELKKYETKLLEIWENNKLVVMQALQQWQCYGDNFQSFSEFDTNLRDGDLGLSASASTECVTLSTGVLSLQAGIDANLSALKKYRDLPRDVFEAENFLADYANGILGYAEAILNNTAGYIADNRAALEGWKQMFYDVQNIIESFKAILDVFIDYQDSCDTCQTTRTDVGYQNLIGIFFSAAVPDIPVIPMPKLPNITIDVSQVQAGVDIVLPKFAFKPEPLALPDLNDFIIDLPDAPPVNFAARLPEFGFTAIGAIPDPPDLGKFILDLPDLPEIEIPNLPRIPKPPSLEGFGLDFFDEIGGLLDAVSAILRIVCLIKKGFIPMSELQIKGIIEGRTSRPLDVILPLDFSVGFQAPAIEITYLEELRIILETNFNINLDQLNLAAGVLADTYNEFETNLTSQFENVSQSFVDDVIPSGTLEIPAPVPLPDEVDLDIDLPGSDGADLDVELPGAEAVLELHDKLTAFNQLMPDEITLVATTKTITRQEFKGLNLDRDFEIPQHLADQITTLIAYRNDPIVTDSVLVADTNPEPKINKPTQIVTKTFKLAAVDNTRPDASGGEYNPEGGMYFFNNETSTSEKIVDYQGEREKAVQMLIVDLDDDRDDDFLYTRGNEIYFKARLENSPRRLSSPRVTTATFSEISLNSSQTTNVETPGVNASVSYQKANLLTDLTTGTLVIDTYLSGFESLTKHKRFIVNSNGDESPFESRDSVAVSEGLTVRKEGFEEINYKTGSLSNIELPLENKSYLATIYLVNPTTDQLEVLAARIALTPNVCNDGNPPEILLDEGDEIDVSVSNPIDINVGDSVDSETEITEIFIDTDLDVDSDGDGNLINDRNLQGPDGLRNLSRFRLSAVEETGTFQIAIWAIDAAGNSTYRIITINVVAPQIIIDEVEQTAVRGHLETPDEDVPLRLIRNRKGLLQEISQTETDTEGNFVFNDLVVSDLIHIYDIDNEQLFEISESTGSVRPLKSNGEILVLAAKPGDTPTSIQLRDEDQIVTNLVRISESNFDVEVLNSKPRNNELATKKGVILVDESNLDDFKSETIPGDDPGYSGGATITKDGQRKAIIDTDGSIILLGSDLTINLQQIDTVSRYQWFEIRDRNRLVASVFVGVAGQKVQLGQPDITPRDLSTDPYQRPVPPSTTEPDSEDTETPSTPSVFSDISPDDPDAEVFNYLESLGIIDGVERDGQKYFEPDRFLTRSEYAKIILKTMCIEPRPEAYQAPQVFADIPFVRNLPWYYPQTKETFLQGFFTGYLGEIDPATGLAPFKPLNTITRAEAVKVILEALESKRIVNLSAVPVGTPWYEPFVAVSQNMRSIITDSGYEGTNFILTPDEANAPLRNVNRREFAIMAYRVLLVNNCLLEDTDGDGIPYYYEVENDLDPTRDDSTEDNDGDGSTNVDEYVEGGDPAEPAARNEVEPGIFLKDISCQTCPCLYRLEYETDILEGDELFVILQSTDGEVIHRRSDTVTFSQ